ncbi:hypothetical protein TASIC1_0002024100 [Trichoderma asperellum]|uniref:Zn(2)-C6 fungal-type domain-containing protein n=1 Tax=Trichoderma asperellum TaxID=101201 RepID=A0A6V8QKP9_TRIAP|nr:hypothetical protein LI328DRAFT_158801 [Trichoderma asperelloides]GFP53057.1 hypothetical protein TASIC1_0002024100 [Trichoderma asperellum]
MPPPPENEPHKRKRDLQDDGGQPAHLHQLINHEPEPSGRRLSVPVMSPASQPYINFLPRHHYAHLLGLLPGDLDTFSEVIYLISEYEGVLDRSESLAASLGARLTGPRFLRGIERFFDGPIKTNSPHPFIHSITWLDVVTFAKANPDAFSLVTLPDGARCRQFMYNGIQVEIAEDDWRLIYSGALDKFPLEHIFEEDEAAELATLEIMLQRSSLLYKKADEVAARARLLNRRLESRRKDVARQLQRHGEASAANAVTVSSGFCAINHPPRSAPSSSHSPSHDLHADLLHQFVVASMQNQPPQGPPPGYYHHQQQSAFGSAMPAIATGLSPLAAPILEAPPYQPLPVLTYPNTTETTATASSPSSLASILAPVPGLAPSPTTSVPASSTPAVVSGATTPTSNSLPPAPAPTPVPIPALPSRRARGRAGRAGRGGRRGAAGKDLAPEVHRALVLKKADTVNKGDVIFPTCDRCRRLRLQCVKHLSACRGCTKKHARCSWRNVTDEEAEIVRHQLEIIEREAQKQRDEAAAAAAGKTATQAEASNNPSAGSGPANSAADASSSAAADSTSQVELVSRPASVSALALAAVAAAAASAMASSSSPAPAPAPAPVPAPVPAPATIEPPLKLVPTSRLTRIDSAPPSVQRNPPRTGHLSAILSPPDYEPRPFHSH